MRPIGAAKIGFWLVMTGLVVTAAFGSSASLTACGESGGCTKLRNDTYATKEIWDACDPAQGPAACIKVPGNSKDCTGVLTCDFAVNPHYRAEAEQATYTIGERSQGCYLCAIPNCVAGELAYCEPISRRCIVITDLLEAGPGTVDLEAAAPVPTVAPVPVFDASFPDVGP